MNNTEFSPEMMDELIRRATSDVDLSSEEIPRLDLYIDQILTLISEKNARASDRYRENHLTKTMINNYSKEGLIMPVKGKKYSREHIVQMLLIYSLKSTLSIGEIHSLLAGVYREGFDGDALIECYDAFVALKDECRERARECATSLIEEKSFELADSRDFCLSLMGIVSLSAYLRAIAEEMLLARYPVPMTAKEEEKLEKEKNKAKKSSKKNGEGKEMISEEI